MTPFTWIPAWTRWALETITAWSPESAEIVATGWWRWGLLLLFPEGWFLARMFGLRWQDRKQPDSTKSNRWRIATYRSDQRHWDSCGRWIPSMKKSRSWPQATRDRRLRMDSFQRHIPHLLCQLRPQVDSLFHAVWGILPPLIRQHIPVHGQRHRRWDNSARLRVRL